MIEHGFTPEQVQYVSQATYGLLILGMAFSRAVRAEVRRRQGNRCDSCGEKQIPLPVHHIVPASHNGSSIDIENAAGLCDECHQEIDNETFGGRRYPQVHTRERYYPQGNGLL